MKKVLIGLAVLLAVVVAGMLYLRANLDQIVAGMIEKYGTQATGTAVNVASVELGLAEGRGTIRGLSVANPEGFSGHSAFQLREVTLDLDPQSLAAEPIVIEEIVVAAPLVRFELNGTGQVNLNRLKSNLERNTASAEAGSGDKDAAGSAPPRIRIRRFIFSEGTIQADTTAAGGEEKELVLPSVTLTDVGGVRGATPGDLGRTVMGALAEQAVASAGKARLEGYARKRVQEELDKQLGDAAGSVGESVKGLLGKPAE